jgi:hypothetical protein
VERTIRRRTTEEARAERGLSLRCRRRKRRRRRRRRNLNYMCRGKSVCKMHMAWWPAFKFRLEPVFILRFLSGSGGPPNLSPRGYHGLFPLF